MAISSKPRALHVAALACGQASRVNGRQLAIPCCGAGIELVLDQIDIVNGAIVGPDRLNATLTLAAGQVVFFTAEATHPGTLGAFTIGAPTTAAGEQLPYDVRLAPPDSEAFGGGYRNWWFGD
ncbi:MAG TPA: hypothetical protein VG758_17020, partial [Hyphomicrobiaceae bacterium]|nr:hypothetical protein [Hyphomicrobiaceae bacterium]